MYARTVRSDTSPVSGAWRPAGALAPARLDRCRRSPSESSTQEPDPASGPLDALGRGCPGDARASTTAAGSSPPAPTTSRSSSGPPDDRPFGDRLRELVADVGAGGLIVLGSGSIPLATANDRQAFVAVAGGTARRALANNRYSADVVAIARAETLPAIPDLPGDNALPRWLEEVAGYQVDDLRRRWRLAIDIDGPLDLVLVGASGAGDAADLSLLEIADRRAPAPSPPTRAPSCWSPAGPRRERWPGSSGTPRRGPGRGSRSAAFARRRAWRRARRRRRGARPAARIDPRRSCSTATGPASLGDHLARFARRGDRRHAGPARPPGRSRGGRLARRRGPFRLRPAARRADRRSVAPRADRVGRGGADPDPARRATPSSVRACGWSSAGRRGARHGRDAGHPPRSRPGPRCGRAGRGSRGADPRRDRARRADHVRPVHGPRAVRPRWRLLPGRGRAPRSRRRLPDRPGGAPDLRRRAARAVADAWDRLGPAGSVRAPRVRRRDRHARHSPSSTASPPSTRTSRRACATTRSRSSRAGSRRSRRGSRRPAMARVLVAARRRAARRSTGSSSPTRSSTRSRPSVVVQRRRPARGPRRIARRRVRRRRGRSVDARAGGPPRRRRRRPSPTGQRAEICLAVDRLGRATRRPASTAASSCSSTTATPPPSSTTRPASRRHAPRLPPPSRPRRPVRPRRAPGPDRPRRRHRGRASRGAAGLTTSGPRPRPSSSSASAPRTSCARSRPIPPRRWRTTSRSARPSCGSSTRPRWAASGSWPSGAAGRTGRRSPVSGIASLDRSLAVRGRNHTPRRSAFEVDRLHHLPDLGLHCLLGTSRSRSPPMSEPIIR